LGVPYAKVMLAALIPALLYFFAVWVSIHIISTREGMKGLPRSELPRFFDVIRHRWVLFAPLFVIIGLLVKGFSPTFTGFYGIVSIVVFTSLYRETRFGLKNILHGLEVSGMTILQILSICACAGIIVALVFLSGLGLKIPYLVRFISQGNVIITLAITMIGAIILGMGLPTTAGYIILATLGGAVLIDVGIPPLAAHLFILYFVVTNNVTPPVALASYAAASVAQSDPWKTAILAFKFALAGFIVPYFFVFNPALLMEGAWYRILWAVITSVIGVTALATSAIGYFNRELSLAKRGLLMLAALVLIEQTLWTDLVGFAILSAIYLFDRIYPSKETKKVNIP
jgi:TRAP transporter 4TM/12TM fusion protein